MSRLLGSTIALLTAFIGTSAAQNVAEVDSPLKDVLPPPKTKAPALPLTSDDLDKVFEILLQGEAADSDLKPARQIELQVARARALDAAKPDGFITALHASRPDLAGVPFTMGDMCRSSPDHAKSLFEFARGIRTLQGRGRERDSKFWEAPDWAQDTHGVRGAVRIAALMQILADGSRELKLGLVKYLAGIESFEASDALARLAIFSEIDEVQVAAAEALRNRADRDYTDRLLAGLRYPYPPVAKRAANALIVLRRKDLTDKLIDVLSNADPRAPEVRKFGETAGPVVRELVRVNVGGGSKVQRRGEDRAAAQKCSAQLCSSVS